MIRFQTNNWTDRDSLRNHMQEEHILHAFMRNDALCLSYTDTKKKANQHTLAGFLSFNNPHEKNFHRNILFLWKQDFIQNI